MTTNLVFTVTLFIYHLVFKPGVFRFNHPIKYHEQKFCIKFAFQGSIEKCIEKSIENCKTSVFGLSTKMSIPVLNFSTESAKELTLYGLLFLIAIYSPKNDNKHSSEMRN